MHPILKRSLMFVALVVVGLALYVFWFGLNADKFNESAIPYLEKVLPELAKWKYSDLKPLLSSRALAKFETDEGKSAYQLFTRLGKLESISKPEYKGFKSETISGLGQVNFISYSVSAQFETGPALIKIILLNDGQTYFIHNLRINSDVYSELQG